MRKVRLYIMLFICFLHVALGGHAQTEPFGSRPSVSAKSGFERLQKEVSGLINEQPDSAAAVLKGLLEASTLSGDSMGKAIAHLGLGYLSVDSGNCQSALTHFKTALVFSDTTYTSGTLAVLHNNIAGCYQLLSMYDEAAHAYEKAIYYAGKHPPVALPVQAIYSNYALLLSKMGHTGSAKAYQERVVAFYREARKDALLGHAYNNLGLIYQKEKAYANSLPYFDSALQIARESQMHQIMHSALTNRGRAYLYLRKGPEAVQSLLAAKAISDHYKINSGHVNIAKANLGSAYLLAGDNKQAEKYLSQAFQHPSILLDERLAILSQLAELYEYKGQPAEAIKYLRQHYALKDSIENENIRMRIGELEERFQSAEKDRKLFQNKLELNERQKSLDRKNLWIVVITGACALLLMILTWRHQWRSRKLENQKEIARLTGMLEGEEKERSRLAYDLHDGVNSRLAALQMMVRHLGNEQPEVGALHIIGNALTETSTEVRRIAHNLVPEDLILKGLKRAIEDFGKELFVSKATSVDIQCYGNFELVDLNLQLNIYRIIQELLHNIVKHAGADKIILLLNRDTEGVTLVIEDNGNGGLQEPSGDSAVIQKGQGLKSIRDRVKVFQGRLQIASPPGKGTHVEISFPPG